MRLSRIAVEEFSGARDSEPDEDGAAILARATTTERCMAEAVRALAAQIEPGAPPGLAPPGLAPPGLAAPSLILADAVAVLWARVLKFDAADPLWPDRDRCVVPAGLGGLIPALLQLSGHAPGLMPEAAAPAGQGVASGLGFALAERALAARFGKSLVDHRSWVVAGEAELSGGAAYEAIRLAGQLRLEKLAVICAEAAGGDEISRCFIACNWAVKRIDAFSQAEIGAALSAALRSRKPMLILCRPAEETPAPAASVRADAARLWRAAGSRGSRNRRAWLKRLTRHPLQSEFSRVQAGRLPENWPDMLACLRSQILESPQPAARSVARVAGGALDALLPGLPDLVVASTAGEGEGESNGCCATRSLVFGPRVLGLGASLAGMALHGGLLPCGIAEAEAGEWLAPLLRFLALAEKRAVLILNGPEDGGLAAIRTMPGVNLLQPADAVEALECFELAFRRMDGPSVLLVSRAPAPDMRSGTVENQCARGGYVLAEADGPRRATLIAAGPDLPAAMAARTLLAEEEIAAAVVSLPCWALFAAQDRAWRDGVLGGAPRFGLGACNGVGWDRWLGENGVFVTSCLQNEGAARYPHEQLTPESIAGAVRRRLSQGEDRS